MKKQYLSNFQNYFDQNSTISTEIIHNATIRIELYVFLKVSKLPAIIYHKNTKLDLGILSYENL